MSLRDINILQFQSLLAAHIRVGNSLSTTIRVVRKAKVSEMEDAVMDHRAVLTAS